MQSVNNLRFKANFVTIPIDNYDYPKSVTLNTDRIILKETKKDSFSVGSADGTEIWDANGKEPIITVENKTAEDVAKKLGIETKVVDFSA